jgi:Flp pilus assembly protein TadD
MARKTSIQDVIGAIEEALDAAETLADGSEEVGGGKQAAIDAINQIRRGDYANAITTLEREFLPKWQSTGACREAYRKSPIVGALAEAA